MGRQGFAPLMLLVGLAALIASGGALYYARSQSVSPTPTPSDTVSVTTMPNNPTDIPSGEIITVTGELVCLPHKQRGEVETMECTFGIKTAEGTYYGINADPDTLTSIGMRDIVKVTGTLQPNPNTIYTDSGTITVQSLSVVKKNNNSDGIIPE